MKQWNDIIYGGADSAVGVNFSLSLFDSASQAILSCSARLVSFDRTPPYNTSSGVSPR